MIYEFAMVRRISHMFKSFSGKNPTNESVHWLRFGPISLSIDLWMFLYRAVDDNG
jgi:hypothetical protein